MQAVYIDRFNDHGKVGDLPEPTLDANSIMVRVGLAGINPVDWKTRAGKAGSRRFPLVLGQDFAGVVERVGGDVTRLGPGDRVFGMAREYGSFVETTVVPEDRSDSPIARIPDDLDDERAAALPTAGLTALAALDALCVRSGTTLLVIGAAGYVGSLAVQLASKRGAVVTACVKPRQEQTVLEDGAREIVASPDIVNTIGGSAHRQFDAVLDLVNWGENLKRNVSLIAPAGRLVSTLHVADEAWFAERNIIATNLRIADARTSSAKSLGKLGTMVAAGELRLPVSETRSLPEAPEVLDAVESGRAAGKVLLRIDSIAG